jgi:hypothetical protein
MINFDVAFYSHRASADALQPDLLRPASTARARADLADRRLGHQKWGASKHIAAQPHEDLRLSFQFSNVNVT